VDKLTLALPDRAAFEASVKRIVAAIHAGEIFQTNLCRSIEVQTEPGNEWELFRRMRSINPARYEGFLRVDSRRSVLSMSPELFLKVENGIVESQPIKGTRPRGGNPENDDTLARELQTSEKDRAELAMIVDVARNDLGRVCETGSVEVIAHAELMSLPTVHHLFSTVKGRLREGIGPVDLLRATFPAASITGAPKIEAMRIAKREEGQERGPCMGAIGWISLDGRMELSVAIRTAFAIDGRVRYYSGCGITAGSDPQAEFEESSHKAAAFERALRREGF
jgi:para-aminobenzoate synthetase component 1